MQMLEIISLRTSGSFEREAHEYMKNFCEIVKKHNLSEADLYVHDSIPGDLAIVIISRDPESIMSKTALGNYMMEVLKQFGLVDYNCWHLAGNK